MSRWSFGLMAVLGCLVSQLVPASAAAQWGSIKGQVLLDGNIFPIPDLNITKDQEVCMPNGKKPPNEALVVDPATKGISNVIVYLRKKPDTIHPDLMASKTQKLLYDQKTCVFIPRVMVVRTDQKVEVLSDDAVAHNTRGNPLAPGNKPFNFTVAANAREGKGVLLDPFKSAERLPTEIKCDIHPWMTGYWIILDHPYGTVSGKDGTFELANVPPGEHELRVWHELIGYVEKSVEVKVDAGKTSELKVMKVPAKKLEEALKKS